MYNSCLHLLLDTLTHRLGKLQIFLYNTPMTFPYTPTPAQLQFAAYTKGLSTLNSYRQEPSKWDMWDFIRMVTSFYYKDISEHESLKDEQWFMEFWEQQQFKLVTIYDHAFDSDESCSLQVLTSFDMPVAAWKKIGDKNSYDDGMVVLNNAWGLDMSKTVFEHQRDADELIADENLDVAKWIFEKNQYLIPVEHPEVDPLTYLIETPSWMLGHLDPTYNTLQVVDEVSNTTLKVTKIEGVKKSGNSWSSDSHHRTTVTLENGETKEVDTTSILVSPMRS